jgi:hypothetical protein
MPGIRYEAPHDLMKNSSSSARQPAALRRRLLPRAPTEPELRLLHRWLDSWRGIGDVVRGMARQEFDLELRRYNGRGWRAMFVPRGFGTQSRHTPAISPTTRTISA